MSASRSRPAELFTPDKSLLNPRFETYRLQAVDPAAARGHRLPGEGATQSRVGYGKQQLGFKEVRSRISWDHLDTRGGRGVYIDTEWNVVGFELDGDLDPTFTTLASLPQPVASGEQHAEYPRALALSDTLWAVSTGSGSVYLLEVSAPGQPFTGKFTARYDLENQEPFILYAAHSEGDTHRLLLAKAVVQPLESGGSKYAPRSAVFDLLEVVINGTHTNEVDSAPETLKPEWVLQGGDLPLWAEWSEGGWVVLSEEPFEARAGGGEAPETEAERAAREHKERKAKLGLGAHLPSGEATPPETPAEPMDEDEPRSYPFHWVQDQSSVTVTIPLPAGTPRGALSVDLTASGVRIAVQAADLPAPLFNFLSAGEHAFWSDIVLADSTWTYDAGEGRLELELQKQEGDARWPAVFAPGDDSDAEDVPETFAPATLAAVRESFAQARTRAADEPAGAPPALPALLREQLDFDEEDDFAERTDGAFSDLAAGGVGRAVLVGHVVRGAPAWSRQAAAVLSLPLRAGGGVIVRHAVDGLLFTPTPGQDPARAPWSHRGTNPALAFVMSSKRDLRLVRHAPSPEGPLVLAFDAGSGTGQGNVYMYWPPKAGEDTARQGVLGVSGGDRGALLGVGEVRVGARSVVVALCEKALVVLDL